MKLQSLCLVVALLVWPACAQAEKIGSLIDVLYPQVGRQGTTVEVIADGAYLEYPEDVLFYEPGIRCTRLEKITEVVHHQTGKPLAAAKGQAVRMMFEIAADAAPGEYHLRLRTRDNLSELQTFWVTSYPVVFEEHAWLDHDDQGRPIRNDAPRYAQAIPLGCTVCGYLPQAAAQDDDWYSVECHAGQRLSVEVVAARLGTWHYGVVNDPAVSIFDDQGRELARNDDNALLTQDPVVSVAIPRDGRYFIHMRQQMDDETSMRHYLMHVGTFPRPLVTFPLGGPAGTTTAFALLGDALGSRDVQVALPATPGPFEGSYFEINGTDSGVVNAARPNRIHIAPFGDVFETGKHVSQDDPQPIAEALPLALNGRIEREGEVDWYRFIAKKGERYRVRTYAKTLDSELDAKVWIRPAPGNTSKRIYEEDDSRWEPHDLVGHHYREQVKDRLDPIFMFEPDTDGEWLIGVGDTRREFSPLHIYRVELQPHVDSAFVYFTDYPSQAEIVRDRIVLFPGHSYLRPMNVQPGFGSKYDGPLQLRAVNLPPGVTIEASPFQQTDGIIPVLFKAAAAAPIVAAAVDFVVEPVDPAARKHFQGGFVQVTPATNQRGGYAMLFHRLRKMAVAVVDGAAFDLEIEPPQIPLVRNGELDLTVKVRRHPGFAGAVYCEMDWLPPGVNKQPPLIIPADVTKGTYKLSAMKEAATKEYLLSITGRENEGGNLRSAAGFHYVASPFVSLTVGEPYLSVKLERTAIGRGTVGTIVGKVDHHKAFAGQATLALGRLPFGVRQVQPFPTIKAGQRTATFNIEVTRDCLVGQYKDIFCEVTVQDGGQEIHQQSGSGVLRVDPERAP